MGRRKANNIPKTFCEQGEEGDVSRETDSSAHFGGDEDGMEGKNEKKREIQKERRKGSLFARRESTMPSRNQLKNRDACNHQGKKLSHNVLS